MKSILGLLLLQMLYIIIFLLFLMLILFIGNFYIQTLSKILLFPKFIFELVISKLLLLFGLA